MNTIKHCLKIFRHNSKIICLMFSLMSIVSCCTKTSSDKIISGNYYYSVKTAIGTGHSMSNVNLLYINNGERKIISKHTGSINSSTDRSFNWKVFGKNIVYVEYNPSNATESLKLFSPETGVHILSSDYIDYPKVIVNDSGITC